MWTLDMIDTWLQTLVLAVCAVIGIRTCLTERKRRKYIYITCALSSGMLGDLTYALFIWITGDYPHGFSAADLSYIGAYLFFTAADLYFMEKWTPERRQAAKRYRKWAWAGVACTVAVNAAMLIELYIWDYDIASSLIYLLPICILAYFAVLVFFADDKENRPYHITVLIFLFAELMMFLSSSFGINFVYYFFDIAWTALFPFIIPMARKGDKA